MVPGSSVSQGLLRGRSKASCSVDIGAEARSVWLAHATWIANGHDGCHLRPHQFRPRRHRIRAIRRSGGPRWLSVGPSPGFPQTERAKSCSRSSRGARLLRLERPSSRWGWSLLRDRAAARASASSGLIVAISAAAAVAFVLGAYGLAGAGATDGSVDLLWSAAAVAAAGMGLVLPLGGEHARAAAVLAVAAGLTKYEGIVTALILFVLIGARWLSASRPSLSVSGGGLARRRGLVAATACAFGVAGVLAWPIGAAARHATEDDYLTGQRVGSFLSRGDATWHAMTAQLHLAGLALAIGLVAALVLALARRQMGFGSDGWIWILGVAEVLVIAGAYVAGTNQASSWLAASVDRTTLFADCLGLALVAWWCVIGIAVALAPPGSRDHRDATSVPPGAAGKKAGASSGDNAGASAGDGAGASAGDKAGDDMDVVGPVVLHPGP